MNASKSKILLVDDDPMARLSFRTVLDRLELDVVEASRPGDAIAALEQNPGEFAVAVLDLKLAGASGLDLLRDLKQRDPRIEAIMVTGFETIEAAKRAIKLGACDFISKPFEVPALTAAVHRALKLHGASLASIRREQELRELLEEMGPAAVDWVRLQRGMVHDVRNMLCVVRSYHHHMATMLAPMRQLTGEEAGVMKSHVGVVGRQLDMIVDMLNRQSAVWRTESSQAESSNAAPLLEDLALLIQRHPEARHCDVALDIRSKSLHVAMTASELSEVLLNVMLNAAQSSPGRLKIQVEADVIDDGAKSRPQAYEGVRSFGADAVGTGAKTVRILVRDDGNGIAREVLARLGNEQVTTKGSRGSGLGISVVVETVKKHHGRFTLRSTVGRGTEVELLFPQAATSA